MVCENCGKEIEEGSIYCNYCGRALQIVPNYNLLDEEILPEILEDPEEKRRRLERQRRKNITGSQGENSDRNRTHGMLKKRQQILLMICGAAVFVLFCSLFLYNRYNSYSHIMSRAAQAEQEERYEDARKLYLQAMGRGNPITPRVNLAKMDYLQGDYDEAIRSLEELISQFPEDSHIPEAYKQLMNFYGATGNYEKMRALAADPPNEEVAQLFSTYVLDTVTFSEKGGTFHDDVLLQLSVGGDRNHRIYYTIDGSDPDKEKGILYAEPVLLVDGTTTVKAVCVDENGRKGEIREEVYTIKYRPPEKPIASPRSGTFLKRTKVTLTAPEGASIYYTWNGKIPNSSSTKYESPITIPEGNNILTAIVVDKHGLTSDILRLNYEYLPQVGGGQTAAPPENTAGTEGTGVEGTGDSSAGNSTGNSGAGTAETGTQGLGNAPEGNAPEAPAGPS